MGKKPKMIKRQRNWAGSRRHFLSIKEISHWSSSSLLCRNINQFQMLQNTTVFLIFSAHHFSHYLQILGEPKWVNLVLKKHEQHSYRDAVVTQKWPKKKKMLIIKDPVKGKSYNVYNGRSEHVAIICVCTVQAHNAYQQSYVILFLSPPSPLHQIINPMTSTKSNA